MDNFAIYEDMKNQGADIREIYSSAKSNMLDKATCIRLLMSLYQLSLVEANDRITFFDKPYPPPKEERKAGVIYPPLTIEDGLNELEETLDKESLSALRRTEKRDLISAHFGLGMWIRNNFALHAEWSHIMKEYIKKTGNQDAHPDDVSQYIIEQLWERLQKK